MARSTSDRGEGAGSPAPSNPFIAQVLDDLEARAVCSCPCRCMRAVWDDGQLFCTACMNATRMVSSCPGSSTPAPMRHQRRLRQTPEPGIRLEHIGDETFSYFADDSSAAHPNGGRMEPEE